MTARTTSSERQIRQLEALLEVSKALAREIRLESLLPVIIQKTSEVLGADRSSLFLYDEERDELWSIVAQGLTATEIRFPVGAGIAGHVARTRETLNIPDAYADARFNPAFDRQTGYRTRSILCTPVLNPDHRLVGVIQVLNRLDGQPFDGRDEALLDALSAHAAVALDRARLIASYVEQQRLQEALRLAHDIQMRMLPRAFPEPDRFDVFAHMTPAHQVGGDFYDFFRIDARRTGFVIGDVSGKGVPAALFMAVTRTLLRATALGGIPAHDCLRTVSRLLYPDKQASMFVTVFYGILDAGSGAFEYCNAGHNPPALLRPDGHVAFLDRADNLPLCVLSDFAYAARQLTLTPGDALLLYTDGVTEAVSRAGEMLEEDGLLACLRAAPTRTAAGLVRHVVDTVQRFSRGAPQSDDLTTMGIVYLPDPEGSGSQLKP